jgi:pimeloyl-ACP methyl ester carboxylesterase
LRASNYYRNAGLYMVATADRPKSISAYALSKTAFLKAINSLPEIKIVSIPYEKTTLPGYFIPANKAKAPLLIIHSGFDGTGEEIYFEAGMAAHERGYNVLLFEGPGQGSVIRVQNLPFRYDWEKVVTPVVDYALANLTNIDKNKIALMGISMGGYLAARACAFEHRIKACIVNGGVYSVTANIMQSFPAPVAALMTSNPDKFNEIMYDQMKTNLTVRWFFNNGMWTFAANTPADLLTKGKLYTVKGILNKIQCPMLVIDSEADAFFTGQPQQVYNEVTSPKKLMKFTADQSAQAHCQMGAIAISNENILDWLQDTFKT